MPPCTMITYCTVQLGIYVVVFVECGKVVVEPESIACKHAVIDKKSMTHIKLAIILQSSTSHYKIVSYTEVII